MNQIIKRLFDLILSILFLIFTSPFLLLIAVVIKLDSPGPILYRGRRVGRGGREFDILKFRTMVNNPESVGPVLTSKSDVRITRVGKFLRNYKLDEIPQLLNIIRGEMSLVGPRPEDPKYVEHYTQEHRKVFSVLPGIASSATVKFRHEEDLLAEVKVEEVERVYLTQILPAKLALDLEYVENMSLLLDIKILYGAVTTVLKS
jgi:lipopolysaccharide/colanic/teichoic acid biosynthesis glycosyltransferase